MRGLLVGWLIGVVIACGVALAVDAPSVIALLLGWGFGLAGICVGVSVTES